MFCREDDPPYPRGSLDGKNRHYIERAATLRSIGQANMTRIVTLGDSITLGMGDPAPGGGWRGWACLLAAGLPKPELHNLADRKSVV